MSYTYVILGISRVAYEEIYALLDQAGYSQAFHGIDDYTVIDMHGIALQIVLQERTPMAEEKISRHPGTVSLLRYFEYQHLPQHLQTFAHPYCVLAEKMVDMLPDSAELTAGLRKLLEAKDCFMRDVLDCFMRAALDKSNMKE